MFGSDDGCYHTFMKASVPLKEPVKCPVWVLLFYFKVKKKKQQTQAYFKPFVKCVHVMLPDCTEVDEKHMLLLFLELCCGNSKSRRWLK